MEAKTYSQFGKCAPERSAELLRVSVFCKASIVPGNTAKTPTVVIAPLGAKITTGERADDGGLTPAKTEIFRKLSVPLRALCDSVVNAHEQLARSEVVWLRLCRAVPSVVNPRVFPCPTPHLAIKDGSPYTAPEIGSVSFVRRLFEGDSVRSHIVTACLSLALAASASGAILQRP